uniref:Putative secreted protein n=1 Tax=Anopheles marajoara TaxID=58244 RepID=A0A2M4CAN5_9DIPT
MPQLPADQIISVLHVCSLLSAVGCRSCWPWVDRFELIVEPTGGGASSPLVICSPPPPATNPIHARAHHLNEKLLAWPSGMCVYPVF